MTVHRGLSDGHEHGEQATRGCRTETGRTRHDDGHLSRIELPRFNGSPSEWPAFSSRFEKRVANHGKDADHYAFLAKCLERCEIARYSREAFENAGMPFAQAWVKLEERFYKKWVAFSGHFRRIIDLPHMTSASTNVLMRIIYVVETSLASARQITEADEFTSLVEDSPVALVIGKLDADTIASITRRAVQQSIPTWVELRTELDKFANRMYYQPKRKEEAAAKPHRNRNPPQREARTVLAATVLPVAAPEAKRVSNPAPAAIPSDVPAQSKKQGAKVRVRTAAMLRICPYGTHHHH
ncbi:AGAP013253-PA-like protein [Anopheles sinensis]|uniref:AGAP013253-PA-like protein n=1 Tax=Anopheles sinensis TaxID=74873 RepID=A0A084VD08_ANOSI|nr:AGAP013253-PA-like protein [Anopheles sinensis]